MITKEVKIGDLVLISDAKSIAAAKIVKTPKAGVAEAAWLMKTNDDTMITLAFKCAGVWYQASQFEASNATDQIPVEKIFIQPEEKKAA